MAYKESFFAKLCTTPKNASLDSEACYLLLTGK